MEIYESFDAYQSFTKSTAMYPGKDEGTAEAILYCALGLGGESGEVLEKLKKLIRGNGGFVGLSTLGDPNQDTGKSLAKELGDALWYLSRLASELGFDFSEIAKMNIDKLQGRKARGVIHGEGDER